MAENPAGLLDDLYNRPGFKIRRCHQFAVSIFMDVCKPLDLTTTQFGLLFVIGKVPRVEQITAARLLGLDRSTCGMVAARLEERGLIRRTPNAADRRRRQLELTRAGRQLLRRAQPMALHAQKELLSPLTAEEQQVFLRCLDKLLDTFNTSSRVPLKPAGIGS
jgi:DNA-binding MarR family transcriptional regulator